jgi:benzoate membrane transport protein
MASKAQGRLSDLSFSAFVSGCVVVLVGMTSSAILVFQAAQAGGATVLEASSWLGALCVGIGVTTATLSWHFRAPVMIAWSTPGAALLVAGLGGFTPAEASGAFLFSGFLILVSGLSGAFEKVMNRIPQSLAAAMLAGVLLHFALDVFGILNKQPLMVGLMILAFFFCKRFYSRYAMVAVLSVGIATAILSGLLHMNEIQWSQTHWVFAKPTFSSAAMVSLGVPLFIVTMASQNLTGFSIMRAYGYHTSPSTLISWTGFINMLTAPFGGFAINLAALTAAIAMGPETHPDPKKRYFAGVVSGLFYIAIGLFSATVTSLFAAFPREMIITVAGLALFSTISGSLAQA